VYSAVLSIVVWRRVNAMTKHPDAYDPAVEHASVWYGHHAVEVPASPPPRWTPMASPPESLAGIPELDLKDVVVEGEKAVLKPETGVVERSV
jgi:hypothetical protein